MGLLVEVPYVGASADYLFARIRCRRVNLCGDALQRRTGAVNPRQALLTEYRWVYKQLDRSMRLKLLPIFEYFELRLLVVVLRYLAVGERTAMTEQLQQSLFEQQVRRILLEADQVSIALCGLEQLLGADYPEFRGLTKLYLRQGPGGLEQALIGGYLQQALTRSKAKPVIRFLRYLLDMRNLQALYKHLHWQVPLAPPLLPGGTLELPFLEKIWREQDLGAFQTLLQKFARQSEPPQEQGVEDYLLQELSSRLRRGGRDPLQLGVVIDYLWRCLQSTREQGVKLFVDRSLTVKEATR